MGGRKILIFFMLFKNYKNFSNRTKRKRMIIPFFILLFLLAIFPLLTEANYYFKAKWKEAHKNNYSSGKNDTKREINDINGVVIHVGEGSNSSIINWLQNPTARSSSHYVVSKTGKITAMVYDEKIAWHAGNWNFNKQTIGIEHEGYSGNKKSFTEKMYRSSAKLTRYLIAKWKIPPTHLWVGLDEPKGIFGHSQVLNPKASYCKNCEYGGCSCHWDPGPYFNWSYYMRLIRGGGKPDLILSPPKIVPTRFLPETEVAVKTRVKNQGKGDTIGDFYVYLYLDGNKIASKRVAPLHKGKGLNKFFYFNWPLDNEKHFVEIKIKDKYDYILESDFSNNNSGAVGKRAKVNNKPIAEIILPNFVEINFGEEVFFEGTGDSKDDSLGDEITEYLWESDINGILSSKASFSTTELLEGKHIISFSVKDKFESSDPVQIELNVIALE